MAAEVSNSDSILLAAAMPCQFNAFSQVAISLAATSACGSNLPMVKKPWNWPGNVLVVTADASILQSRGIFVPFVAQGIGAGGQHIGGRQAGQRLCAGWRGAPVLAIGKIVQIMVAKPLYTEWVSRMLVSGSLCEGCVNAKSVAG